MISNPDLILYACVSKGTTVLAEVSTGNKELKTLALECLKKTPSLHAMFSHTVGKKIYSFLMEDPFVYFAIVDEELGKPEGLGFLKCVKDAFKVVLHNRRLKNFDNLTNDYFHGELTPIFNKLLTTSGERYVFPPPPPPSLISRDSSVDSRSGFIVGRIPSIERPSNYSQKKNSKKRELEEMNTGSRDIPIENMVRVHEDGPEFSVPLHKNGLHSGNVVRRQTQKMWRRYVLTALLMDIMVCCVLLGVWLWVCRGFKCLRE
ncbi:hypothetical protein NE237_011487 [Protea cynaroides]|uniref:Longin domain-containing protein n=1 Tax=Protea cynaroides TaxID=273540 RepID=A0A9Q0GW57_9MAGN|nr:hypothetical protein NE237_011487 [Protea cynaroides]